MIDLISIDPVVDRRRSLLLIDWCLTNVCNFRCSYCPENLHSGSQRGPALKQAMALIDQVGSIEGKAWKHFQFTGGEPTTYRYISDLLRHVRARGHTAGLISNGTRALRWWEQHLDLISEVTLTYHPESSQASSFIDLVELLHRRVNTHVNVAMYPDSFGDCLALADGLAKRFDDISITLKPLLIDFRDTMYSYTDDQLRVLKAPRWPQLRPRADERTRGKVLLTYRNGDTELLAGSGILTRGINRFRGWTCFIGIELITVDSSGRVFRGVCREGGVIGSVSEGLWVIPSEPVVCGRDKCSCLADIPVEKHSPTAPAPGAS